MGPGPGAACAVSLNTSLTPEQRARYQDVAQINRLLQDARTIAIVGLSSDRQKASFFVAGYLQDEGYRIVPVNPKGGEILGEKVYPDVASIPFPVDIVDIFRPPGEIDAVVDQIIARRDRGLDAPAVWMQLRLVNLPAAERASAAGLTVVVDKCVKMEHGRYGGTLHWAGMNTELISARKRRRCPCPMNLSASRIKPKEAELSRKTSYLEKKESRIRRVIRNPLWLLPIRELRNFGLSITS